MLILLPPSEGKATPVRGRPLDLTRMSLPELTAPRRRMIDELVALCTADPGRAASVLGVGKTQHDDVHSNAALWEAPTAPAAEVYTGVLYTALDHASLRARALRRVNRWVVVQSALFGLVRLADRIPSYRLSGSTTLPGIGTVASAWRAHMAQALPRLAGSGLVVDLRSSAYAAFGRPGRRTVVVRVLQESHGRRTVVSHSNKATKGRMVRALAEHDGDTPRTPGQLAEILGALGWRAEPSGDGRLDVVVTDL